MRANPDLPDQNRQAQAAADAGAASAPAQRTVMRPCGLAALRSRGANANVQELRERFLADPRVVKYSDLLNRLAAKHGAKPSSPRPLKDEAFKKPDLGVKLQVDSQGGAMPPGFVREPTQEITRTTMERLFQTVLDTPPDASPLSEPEITSRPQTSQSARAQKPREVRGFRNHAELLKFASVLINDIEDALRNRAG